MSKSKNKHKLVESVLLGADWLNNYLTICRTNGKRLDANGFYLDILKELFEDNIDDSVVIHLLAVIEQNVHLLDCDDKYVIRVDLMSHFCLLLDINANSNYFMQLKCLKCLNI